MLDELKKIGLSENEARVYLALLELGSETAQEIAKKAGVKRATTYVQLDALMKMGLVTSFEKGLPAGKAKKKSYFRAEDPEHLIKIAEREKKVARERESALEEILPGLGKLYLSAGERPRVRFFDGVEGLKTMQAEFLKSGAELVESFSSADDVAKIFPKFGEEYEPQKIKRKIQSKVIYTSANGSFLKEVDMIALRESRYIPPDEFPVSCDISIYKNTVSISVLRGKIFGILVEGEEIAKSMRSFFKLAWEAAEKYKKI
ncbi:hypothetical protein A2926_02470 [Candidatus Giovannonibacteria bacterium RIFCSPLOWO2_01_FULL_44_40]|uniref:Transcription regulator TrmB N-terminal domain-containing protein n=1 Tax=Candidatus Giovannonibacteria bacterium RIFCSPHIGHO2_01_FULL_45_23 TaxID=1798325 RepID=A0A1F5VKP3_9BACT|nr:MAG: hypothetical protein A2834_01545 [Candidatus Giovannonibacteria bacterium RIFCSPHIGHO2_01_FULL_45_23]OGF76830.1 MAG: hypothetical protein A3C77_00315 [Candidatus Giovannonibacteria bacterium RIFCSPHIGHO2_02_FULL_45_13]OGF80224.1 MAG: hypothetical protein A2926_02470 [Candidatus Giovannonibacteria bacterium RIFCSPLOWO2_01_FULL_44_40]